MNKSSGVHVYARAVGVVVGAVLVGLLQVQPVAGEPGGSGDDPWGIGYDVKTKVPVGDFESANVVSSNPGVPVHESPSVTDATTVVEPPTLPDPTIEKLAPGPGWQEVGDAPVRVKGLDEVAEVAVVRPKDPAQGLVGVTMNTPPSAAASPEALGSEGGPSSGLVEVNFSEVGAGYGGAWQDRLVVRAYPACRADSGWLTPPDAAIGGTGALSDGGSGADAACDVGVEIPSEIDSSRGTARFDMADAAAAVTGVFEASAPTTSPDPAVETDGEAGVEGTTERAVLSGANDPLAVAQVLAVVEADTGAYGATPFPVSAEWQVGEGSGEFSYGYDFDLPSASGGATPQLGLQYSSGAVDGMSLPRNAQASPAGLGWDLTVGYIARGYASCRDDGEDVGDLCWKAKDRLSIVLNGRASRLVPIDGTNQYRLRDDPGWKVERVSGGSTEVQNSDADNEAFKVSTPDGTVYWFGRGHGSESTWTVPVFGNNAGEPGHSGIFAVSDAVQAWRWNLDRVVDSSDNLIEYTYDREINHYQRRNSAGVALNMVAYDRGGSLASIRYGFRVGMERARQQVEIVTRDRCVEKLTDPSAACGAGNVSWPDVPMDLDCGATQAGCASSPSFFTKKRYATVRTKTVQGSGETPDVLIAGEYELVHTLPDPDRVSEADNGPATADLWLSKVKRIPVGPAASAVEPLEVTFDAEAAKQNRVDTGQAGVGFFPKFRVTRVRTELGGVIDVTYGHATRDPDGDGVLDYDGKCTQSYLNGRDRWASGRECFAQKLKLGDAAEQWYWFHKYVVTQLRLTEAAQAAPADSVASAPRVYSYEYLGSPAWRHMDDGNVPKDQEGWDDWRGYEKTQVKTHAVTTSGTVQNNTFVSVREVVQFRGMDNALPSPEGGALAQPVTLTVTESGEAPRDWPWMAGKVAEETLKDPANSPTNPTSSSRWLTRTYHEYDSSLATAGPAAVNDPGIKARIVFENRTVGHVNATSGSERVTRVVRKVDTTLSPRNIQAGAIVEVESVGDVNTAGDESCMRTDWLSDADKWLRVTTREQAWRTTCDNTGTATQDADVRLFYDGRLPDATTTPVLSHGLVTAVRTATEAGQTATAIDTFTAYDDYGRVRKITDGKGFETITDYNPGDSNTDLVTSVKVTRTVERIAPQADLSLSETVTLDPRWGLPVRVTDANAAINANGPDSASTHLGYDALGRLEQVWLPGRATSQSASVTYTYKVAPAGVSGVKTSTLRADSGTDETRDLRYDLVDGWGRPLESQVPRAGSGVSGRVISAVRYDEHGTAWVDIPAVPNTDNLSGSTFPGLVNPILTQVDRYTQLDHDPLGRVTRSRQMSRGAALPGAETTTTYHGTWTQTVPPTPMGATRAYTDGLGRTTKVEQFQQRDTGTGLAPSQPREMWATYRYDSRSNITQLTAPGPATPANSDPGANPTGLLNWTYSFDLAGRRTYANDPDTGETHYAFDDNSNITSVDDATANPPVRTDHDSLNRPTRRYTLTGATATELAAWTYDQPATGTVTNALGRLIEERSYTPLGEFATKVTGYDLRGQAKGTTYEYPNTVLGGATGSGQQTYTVAADYNEAGALTEATYPAVTSLQGATVLPASTLNIGYTTNGLLGSMTADPGTASEVKFVDNATYTNINQLNELRSTRAGGGTQARIYGYSPTTGRLTEVAANNFWHNYHYDAAGNIVGSAAWASDADGDPLGMWCYEYDGLGRLTRTRTGNGQNQGPGILGCGTSDARSNITTGQPHDLLYAYNIDRLAWVGSGYSGGSVSYGYPNTSSNGGIGAGAGQPPHAASDLTRSGNDGAGLPTPTTLTYDASGRATKTIPTGNTSGTLTYTYDAQGNQSSTITGSTTSPTSTETYAYDPSGIRLARRTTSGTASGTLTEAAVFLGNTEIRRLNGNRTATRNIATPDGIPVGAQTTSGNRFVLADIRSSIRQTTNADSPLNPNTSYQRHNYYPYGSPTPTTNTPTGPAGPPADRGYLDKTRDPNGTIRLDHRNYTPDLNTLTTPDPLLAPYDLVTLNPYAYAANNPISLTDPSGLFRDDAEGSEGCQYPCDGRVSDGIPGIDVAQAAANLGDGARDTVTSWDGARDAATALIGDGIELSHDMPVVGSYSSWLFPSGEDVQRQLGGNPDSNASNFGHVCGYVCAGLAGLTRKAASRILGGAASTGTAAAANAGSSLIGKSYGLGTVVENPGLAIQGFRGSKTPGHTINRIINRGVSPSMLRDTVANPKVVLRQGSGNYYHLSDDAAVVLRPDGQVVTAYGRADFKQHVLDILADVG